LYKSEEFPYAQAAFTHKKPCEYMFEKLDLKKRVGERVGDAVVSILSSKGENCPKFWFLEAHIRFIHPEHVQPIF